MSQIKVAMVDDHKIVRDGIRAMFLADDSLCIVAEAGDAVGFLQQLEHTKADIAIVDISLPGMDGIVLSICLKERYPEMPVLILSATFDEATVLCAVNAGIKGYLTKENSNKDLLEAIHAIVDGDEYYGEKVSRIIYKSHRKMLESHDTIEKLSASNLSQRETEVLKGFADGLSYDEIGKKLFISTRTVETHKASIMDKLGLKSIADLVKYALRNGLIKLN